MKPKTFRIPWAESREHFADIVTNLAFKYGRPEKIIISRKLFAKLDAEPSQITMQHLTSVLGLPIEVDPSLDNNLIGQSSIPEDEAMKMAEENYLDVMEEAFFQALRYAAERYAKTRQTQTVTFGGTTITIEEKQG